MKSHPIFLKRNRLSVLLEGLGLVIAFSVFIILMSQF